MINETNNYYEYNDSKNGIYIYFILNQYNKSIIFNRYEFSPENIKLFLIGLNLCITTLKDKGFKKFIQKVTKDDWENYLQFNKNWELIYIDLGYIIMCDISKASESIFEGLGIHYNKTTYETNLQ